MESSGLHGDLKRRRDDGTEVGSSHGKYFVLAEVSKKVQLAGLEVQSHPSQ